jgi:hypothetical protein
MGVQSTWQAAHPNNTSNNPPPSTGGGGGNTSNLPPSVQTAIQLQAGTTSTGGVTYGTGSGIRGGTTIRDVMLATKGQAQTFEGKTKGQLSPKELALYKIWGARGLMPREQTERVTAEQLAMKRLVTESQQQANLPEQFRGLPKDQIIPQDLQQQIREQQYNQPYTTTTIRQVKQEFPVLEIPKDIQAGIRKEGYERPGQTIIATLEPTRKVEGSPSPTALIIKGGKEFFVSTVKNVGEGSIEYFKFTENVGEKLGKEVRFIAGDKTRDMNNPITASSSFSSLFHNVDVGKIGAGVTSAATLYMLAGKVPFPKITNPIFGTAATYDFIANPSYEKVGQYGAMGVFSAGGNVLARPFEVFAFKRATTIPKSQTAPYIPQLEAKPIRLESGKVVGIDIKLREGQQTFSDIFTSPKVRTRLTESGIPIEQRATFKLPQPTKQLSLQQSTPIKIFELKETNVMARVSPKKFAELEQARGNLILGLEKSKYAGTYTPGSPPKVTLNPKYVGTKYTSEIIAHEMIHYKTVPTINKIIPNHLESKLSHRLQPSEIIAYGLEKYYAKKGFKADLGNIVSVRMSEPFKPERLPAIPKLKTTSSMPKDLINFGFSKPISNRVIQSRPFKQISKPLVFTDKLIRAVERPSGELTTLTITKEPKVEIITKSPRMESLIKPRVIQIPIIKQGTKQSGKRKEKALIVPDIKTIGRLKLETSQKASPASKPISILIPTTRVTPKVDQKQAQSQSITPISILIPKSIITSRMKEPKEPEPKPLEEISIPKIILDEKPLKKRYGKPTMKFKRSRGFKVAIRRKGKFMIESKSLTKESALDVLAIKLKGSTASTGKLIPTEETPLQISRGESFARVAPTLREYKISKGMKISTPLTFIEKRGTRLSTKAERFSLKSARSNFGGKMKWL